MNDEKFPIRKDIPPPNRSKYGPLAGFTEVIGRMQIGDSILARNATSGAVCAYLYRFKMSGKRFTTRTVKPDVRVWRIA